MKKTGKLLALLLAAIFLLGMAACTDVQLQVTPPSAAAADAPASPVPESAGSVNESAAAEAPPAEAPPALEAEPEDALLPEDGSYTTVEDVSLYLYQYGHLPSNFITKKEAKALGWPGGSLEPYAPGKCIGGDHFGNYEGLLPAGHSYRECDIDTLGASSRGAKRIIFSDDGLIYYTQDHYESFVLLYGEE